KVVVDVFKNGQPRTPVYYRYTVIDFSHSQNDYDEMNAEPVVSVSSGWDVMVVYKVPALLPLEGNPVTTSALYYSLGWLNGLVGWELTWYSPNNKWVIIPTTNYNSIQPAIAEDVYSTSNPTNYFHIAYQENNQIKYYYKFGQVRTGSLSQNSNPICISCNNGFSQNYSPSIIPAGQTARVCWVGYRLVTQEGEYEVEAVPQYKVLFKDPFNTSRYWQFGNDVSAPSFNKSPNFYAFGWREASNQNKFADNNLSTVRTLNTSGQELQICNGTASSNMYAMSYNRNDGLPYYFLMSNNLGSFYSLAKTTAISFSSGREGIVAVDNAEFYFALGDINIDGQTVDFEEISDTVSISDIVSLNQNLISKPMNITDNSSFVYSVQYGINDSLSVAQSLVDQRTVNFKVMLIDNTTGETIGVYDDITYNSSNLYQYNSISYQVNTAGIGNRTIRLKLVLNNSRIFNQQIISVISEDYKILGLDDNSYEQLLNNFNAGHKIKIISNEEEGFKENYDIIMDKIYVGNLILLYDCFTNFWEIDILIFEANRGKGYFKLVIDTLIELLPTRKYEANILETNKSLSIIRSKLLQIGFIQTDEGITNSEGILVYNFKIDNNK
ncbi:MAG TPA: hypothetical protein PLH53_13655, partial [Ignavibacteriaceae bacterium]|nr:hypothetical protein [Ignavibacteriaceae bacterium]